MDYLIKRGKWFYYKRRVPVGIRKYYKSGFVQLSLKTDSHQLAKQRASIFNSELERLWADIIIKGDKNTADKLSQAKETARLHGFSYLTAEQISKRPTIEIIQRLEAIEDKIPNEPEKVAAILGGHPKESTTLSQALDHYFQFQKTELFNKSDDQIRKWKNPRIKAVNNLINLIGDIAVDKVTRDHILRLRDWWSDRILNEGLSSNSPNKDFTYLRTLLSFVSDDQQLEINTEYLFSRVRFTNVASTRPPFPTDFIQNELLNLNNLSGLHIECQIFLFAMADTGARPSELVGLNASNGDIRLDTEIPYIFIRPEKKKALKTSQSKRMIPLVGASLYAFQNLPDGFDHYHRKADALSANINKYLKERNLLPTTEHTVYSLRHSFEDRLTAIEPPEKVQAALMGHKYNRPRYGDGPSLEQKKKWLDKICFSL